MNRAEALARARAALERGTPDAAVRACDAWLKLKGGDVEIRYLRGRGYAALGLLEPAIDDFRRALASDARYLPALADLGFALLSRGRLSEAAASLSAAIALDGRSPELHFALGQCQLAGGALTAAAMSFQAALERNPGYADACNNLGVTLDRLGHLDGAIHCFEQARALRPGSLVLERNLADAQRRSGRVPEALATLRRAVTLQPGNGELLCELAEMQLDAGESAEAATTARSAMRLEPRNARAHAALGMALLGSQETAAAATALAQSLALDPKLVYAAVNLGEARMHLGQPTSAVAAYRAALALDDHQTLAHLGLARALAATNETNAAAESLYSAFASNPGDPSLALTVATSLESLGRMQRAAEVLSQALSRSPASAELHHAAGAFWHRRGHLADAIANYDRALASDPRHLPSRIDRGHALESQGQLDQAVAAFVSASELAPSSTAALAGLASCAFRLCDWTMIDAVMTRLDAVSDGLEALAPFLLIAAGVDPMRLRQVFERRSARLSGVSSPVPLCPARHDRLRVAYLSPDFREHPVAHAVVGVIERHARERVQPIGVSLAAADGSAIGIRLRAAFETFIDASTLSDQEVVARLRELEVDIAVDIAGFTTGARTGILAARCAPVQVNFLGFPATMGARFIDYIVADPIVLPAQDEAAYTERVMRLPNYYLPNDWGATIAPSPGRAAAGLPDAGFIFCVFNNSYKISREIFEIWMRLLSEVPGSILWLRSMHPSAAERLRNRAHELGIAAERLVFAPHVERMDEHLARLTLADLFLDTLPYNAHTTAAHALWAGVPVLTCRGKSFAARVGASVLAAVGLDELITDSLTDYHSCALRLASSPHELGRIRDRLAAARPVAPLFDGATYVRSLEGLYEAMAGGCAPRARDHSSA